MRSGKAKRRTCPCECDRKKPYYSRSTCKKGPTMKRKKMIAYVATVVWININVKEKKK